MSFLLLPLHFVQANKGSHVLYVVFHFFYLCSCMLIVDIYNHDIIVHSLCIHCAFTVYSLCIHYAFIVHLLCIHCAFIVYSYISLHLHPFHVSSSFLFIETPHVLCTLLAFIFVLPFDPCEHPCILDVLLIFS